MTTFTDTHILDDFTNRDFEQIVLCRDPEAGLESVIAVHDTTSVSYTHLTLPTIYSV